MKECKVKEDHHMLWAPVHGLRVEVPKTSLTKAYVENKRAMTKERYEALKDLNREVNATISKVLIFQQEKQEGRRLVWFRGQSCVQFYVFIGSERGCSGMRSPRTSSAQCPWHCTAHYFCSFLESILVV